MAKDTVQSPKRGKTIDLLREKERAARRSLIVDAAERVFAARSFGEVTMRHIAREAGVSPALIYRHFPDQQSLFVEAFLRGADVIIGELGRIAAKAGANGALEDAAERFVRYLCDNDQYFRMMTHFMLDGSLGPGLVERLNAAERALLDRFDELFGAAWKKRTTRLASHALFAALNGVLITFRNYPGRSPREVRRHMRTLARMLASALRDSARKA
ncbi:MAG TPA: TetR/AcrR family transcriptional regulator [Spirochaetota bacterium]|nr:TetR/AcrR family transcriptional regulator [Spirochaetota bacterium]